MSYFSADHSELVSGLGCGPKCNCGPCQSGISGLGQRYEAEEKDGLGFGYYGGFGYGLYGDDGQPAQPESASAPAQEPEQAPAQPEARPVAEQRPVTAESRSLEADQGLLREALSRGIRSPRRVTDIIFFARHPQLKENPAWANNGVLLDEWRQIRERLVVPEMRQRFAPHPRIVRYRRLRTAPLHGPSHFGFGYFAAPPVCESARRDLETIAFDVKIINNELAKGAGLSPTRLSLKQDLLNLDVNSMINSLDSHIASGCCEPALKTLEADVKAIAWPPLVAATKSKLITQIVAAQDRARKDFKHC